MLALCTCLVRRACSMLFFLPADGETGRTGVAQVAWIKGLARWRDRFILYGIKVSFWGSGTLKIVIPVENYPQKQRFRLVDYHSPLGWRVLISGYSIYFYYI